MIERRVALFLCLTLMLGCGSSASKKMSSGTEAIRYPELEAFDENALLGVGYAMEGRDGQKNISEAKSQASNDSFVAATKALEASSIPDKYSDRQAAKDAVVAAAKDLTEKAKGSDSDFEAAYATLLQSIKSLRNPE